MGDPAKDRPFAERWAESVGNQGVGAPQAQIKLLPAVRLLGEVTEQVKAAVADLTQSSRRLECLTKWLIWLTAALAVLTAVSVIPFLKNAVLWLNAHR